MIGFGGSDFLAIDRLASLAARVCSNLATLRFRVMEIAELALIQGPAATRQGLLGALADAEF
jgi:hypothetical protein